MKDIPGFQGRYAITEDGRVWSKPRTWRSGKGKGTLFSHDGRWLSPTTNRGGYVTYQICLPGSGRRCVTAHQLVAKTYLPNPHRKIYVNHIDHNRQNNHVSNLEWVTSKENTQHARRAGRLKGKNRGEGNGHAKLSETNVLELRRLAKGGVPTRELSEKFNVHTHSVNAIVAGRTWAHLPL